MLIIDYVTLPKLYKAIDMEVILFRLAPTTISEMDTQPSFQECSRWSSWNARKTRESPELKVVVGYCPILNAKADDLSNDSIHDSVPVEHNYGYSETKAFSDHLCHSLMRKAIKEKQQETKPQRF